MAWKENSLISLALNNGNFVLIQLVKSPYIVVYDAFREREFWDDLDLDDTPVLFCCGVVKNVFKKSNITPVTQIDYRVFNELPKLWIHKNTSNRKIIVWQGMPQEKSFIVNGNGASLVEKNLLKKEKFDHPSGVFDKIIIENIDENDDKVIDSHELTALEVYPNLNERLLLCNTFGKNVDPEKDILFNRELLFEYKTYVDIISGSLPLNDLGY